ncbi:hypothetical protein WDW89_07705 [Deltaproteobacteria bacterium TL4]
MANKPLAEADSILLLKKKLSLLHELLQLSQKQLTLSMGIELNALLDHKDQCLQNLRKTDDVISVWEQQYPRGWNERERQLLEQVPLLLQDLWDSEEQFEQKLKKERVSLSAESQNLKTHSQLKNYLNSGKPAGKNLAFRR